MPQVPPTARGEEAQNSHRRVDDSGREPRSSDGREAAASPPCAVPPSPRPPPQPPEPPRARLEPPPPWPQAEAPNAVAALVLQLAVCSVLFLFPSCVRAHGLPPPATAAAAAVEVAEEGGEEWEAALQKWKGKTYSLSMPLRVVALRGSYPATWVKDFVEAQGKRLKFSAEFRASLDGLFSEMSQSLDKGQVQPKPLMAADVVSIWDS